MPVDDETPEEAEEGEASEEADIAGRLHSWRSPPVIGVALVAMAAGFGQFGAIAALGDVADEFGAVTGGPTIADRAGLSGTVLGLGLAVIRLASLFSLPLAALVDRIGRRPGLAIFSAVGLSLVVAGAFSPTYWWFVAIFALSRPLLTATNTVAEVAAAEETASRERTKALALVAAGYGVGSGAVAVIRGVAADALGFRGVFALALAPLILAAVAMRWVSEPARYHAATEERPLPVVGAVGRPFRSRLLVLVVVGFAIAAVTGPANSFLFVYAENVLDLSASITAAMVVTAGVTGLLGLLVGRWAADRVGRRVTTGLAMVALALAGVTTYSGSAPLLVAGYLAAIALGSALAPALGALTSELFPTEVRGAVAGWIVAAGVLGAAVGLFAFGWVADAGGRFLVAAAAVFIPAGACAPLLAILPETRGRELEDWEEG